LQFLFVKKKKTLTSFTYGLTFPKISPISNFFLWWVRSKLG